MREYIKVIFKFKWLIFLNTFIITGIAVVVSLILPHRYTSTASLLPPLPGTEFFPQVNRLEEMFRLLGMGRLGASTPSDLFAAILRSKPVMKGVIDDCGLQEIYKTKRMTETYWALQKDTKIKVSPEGIITISTTAKTPILAKKMCESYIKHLDKMNRNLITSIGKKNRIFLEERLKDVKNQLAKAENELKKFQEKHKTISLKEEVEPVLKVVSELKAQIIAKEIQLGILETYATEKNPEIIKIKSELEKLNEKLYDMEYKGDTTGHFGIGFSIPFKNLPKVVLEYARLKRDLLVQEKVFKLLTEQYEQAKIQEVKDTPTVNILEEPSLPDIRSYPVRRVIVGFAFVFSFVCSIILAFMINWWINLPQEEKSKWIEIFKKK